MMLFSTKSCVMSIETGANTMAGSTMLVSMSMLSIVVFVCICMCCVLIARGRSRPTGIPPPASIPAGKCVEKDNKRRPIFGYEYSDRKQDPETKKWTCPSGFSDTGCDWGDGHDIGALQCRRQVAATKGEWVSPYYGKASDHNLLKFSCPNGKVLSTVVLFGGENNNAQTNAIGAFCHLPGGSGEPTNALSNGNPTCGKRDYPHAGQFFKSLFEGFENILSTTSFGLIDKMLKPESSRRLWTPNPQTSILGFTGWEVIPDGCPKSGLCGLNMITAEGTETGWSGGEGSSLPSDHKSKKQTGRCPPGKIVKEIRTKCGDRVDGIQFVCDVP